MLDFCQVCRHYDIVGNKCSKAPKRAIPKSRCADYEFHTHKDLCKYCSHNNYGRCTFSGHKCSVEPLLMNICAFFENKEVMDKKMEYEKKEEVSRIEMQKNIQAIRKRCEEFMQGLVRDFGDIIVADTVNISETEKKKIGWNKEKQIPYTDKSPFIDFSLKFTVYKRD